MNCSRSVPEASDITQHWWSDSKICWVSLRQPNLQEMFKQRES